MGEKDNFSDKTSSLQDSGVIITELDDRIQQQSYDLYDSNIPLEAYLHFAKLEQDGLNDPETIRSQQREGKSGLGWNVPESSLVSQQELRRATWLGVFYLITTDVLGPSNAPWAISQLGYAPGIILYILLGVVAIWTGIHLWRQFIALDSHQFPVKNYSDLAFRIYGPWAAHVVNILQSVQLVFVVGLLVLTSGQALSQMVNVDLQNIKLCFSVCVLVFVFAGMILGQIRSLTNYSKISSVAVFLNLLIILLTMIIVAKYPPNYQAVFQGFGITQAPIVRSVVNHDTTLSTQVTAVMQMALAYGGSFLYVEFMSEMKNPWNFWKALICSQALVLFCYLFYGVFVYSYQGQFVFNPANQGVSPYNWLTALNSLSIVLNVIGSALYGNVGVKVVYNAIVVRLLDGPEITTKRGRLIWTFLVLGYWSLSFVVGSGIPNVGALSGILSATIMFQFTFSFPPLMQLGLEVFRDAGIYDKYDEATGVVSRVDTWKDLARWKRGIVKNWYWKLAYLLLFLAAVATAALGTWASVESIIGAFALGHAKQFGCVPSA